MVVHVADGGTITVLDSNKEQNRVRIAGIDAPEKGQSFGNASKKRLGELVAQVFLGTSAGSAKKK